jgi:hypothetical protein
MNSTQSDQIAEKDSQSDNPQAEAQATVRSLRTLLEGDEREQRETFEYLKQALDEDRPSNRRLFQ